MSEEFQKWLQDYFAERIYDIMAHRQCMREEAVALLRQIYYNSRTLEWIR